MDYKTTMEWVNGMKDHKCDNKDFLPCDDALNRKVGVVCSGCGAEFYIGLLAMRNSMGETPQEIRDAFKSNEAKIAFMKSCI